MDETKAKLTSALRLQPFGSIAMADLASHYKKTHKEKLDFKGLGFESLQQLLEAMPDTVQVKYNKKSSDFRVILVNYEVNEAIEREINYKSEMASSEVASDSKRCYDKRGTIEDAPVVNHLRQKPIPTAFRGQYDWELYINGFPNDTKENDLMDAFKSFGCTRVRVKKRENETLYGFATFREYSEAEEAFLTLDGQEFRGRKLDIRFAKSSIASEDEIRTRLGKTQFTAEVTSSRHRKLSANDGSVDRGATGQPYDVNLRRTECQPDSFYLSPVREDESPWLTWQPFAASGYSRTEDEKTVHRKAGTVAHHPHGTKTSNGSQNQFATGGTSSGDGYNCSDKTELHCDRRRRAQSNSTRIVQLFADIDSDTKHSNSKETTEATVEIDAQPCSSESDNNPNSARIVQMFSDTKFDRKQLNSIEATKATLRPTAESEDKTGQVDSLSSEDISVKIDSSRNSEFHCITGIRSLDSEEIRSTNRIPDKAKTHKTLNRDSEKDVSEHMRDGKDIKNCSLFGIGPISCTSLSKAKSNSSISDDNRDAMRGKTDANIEVHISGSNECHSSFCNEKLYSDNHPIDNKRRVENNPILLQVRKTAFNNARKWLRVYVRDEILLAKDMVKWIKIYSRNDLHLGQVKFQCRNMAQFQASPLPENSSPSNIANSLKPKTEPVSSESLAVEAETLLPSYGRMTQRDSFLERCCDNIPETMDVQFLQRMLKETQLRQGFLSQGDLPDELDLMVIHVCDSKHFWGSVINSGEFMHEFEDHFQMMNDITVRAGPEFQLDKARVEDKRAGVIYQDEDWCRVWIRSRVSNSEIEVFYVDFGNSERRLIDDLWVLPRKSWNLRPGVLPFHLKGTLTKRTLFKMVNTKITVKLIRSQSSALNFVVTVIPYKEFDSVEID